MLLISTEEMLSSSYNQMIPLKCDGCQATFNRVQKQVKSDYKRKSQFKHFCSNICQGNLLKKELVQLTCANCGVNFSTSQADFRKRSRKTNKLCCSQVCANKINIYRPANTKDKISKSLKARYIKELETFENKVLKNGRLVKAHVLNECQICKNNFYFFKIKKTCSIECQRQMRILVGKKAGIASASRSYNKRNRSSNEKLFFAKIKELYIDAVPNKRLFNGWDADIIIPSLKVAIHWNGVWHYKSILGQELLDKVQLKDSLRYKAIEEYGYKNYIIQDMGKMNPIKVDEEFNKFTEYLKEQNGGLTALG